MSKVTVDVHEYELWPAYIIEDVNDDTLESDITELDESFVEEYKEIEKRYLDARKRLKKQLLENGYYIST